MPTAPQRLIIRSVRTDDSARLAAFFRRLSPNSRVRRFHGAVNGLPQAVLARLCSQDPALGVALVAVLERHGRERIVAEARYAIDDETTHGAEFAIAVDDRFQHCGLGKRLAGVLLRVAARRRVDRLYGEVQADNAAMLGLAQALGFRERRARDARLKTVEWQG